MIEVKRVLAPINGMSFEEINSVISENYIGVFTHHADKDQFAVMPLDDEEFEITFIPAPDTLEELDKKFYEAVEEHIEKVSDSGHLEISVYECE